MKVFVAVIVFLILGWLSLWYVPGPEGRAKAWSVIKPFLWPLLAAVFAAASLGALALNGAFFRLY